MKFLNRLLLATVAVLTVSCGSETKQPQTFTNPLDVAFGDPYILQGADSKFYMYGTSDGVNGFKAYSSDDMVNWKEEGVVFEGGHEQSWGVDCYWAPEVYLKDGKYYMFFSANWKNNPANDLETFRIGIAVSDSPTGPFKEVSDKPLFDPGFPVIDGNLLFDDNGKVYLYFSRCCYKNPVESEVATWAKDQGLFKEIEESWVYGVEIKPDFSEIIGEPVLLLSPPKTMDDKQAEWESRSVTSKEVNRRWTEGSFILKEGGKYYMMYSANHFGGEHYAVGYATSDSPLGPFTKAPVNPILEKNVEKGGIVTGTGHNMVITLPNGEMWCVYHGRTAATGDKRVVFIDPISFEDGKLVVKGPNTEPQAVPNVK